MCPINHGRTVKNKIIFISVLFALFMVSALSGYLVAPAPQTRLAGAPPAGSVPQGAPKDYAPPVPPQPETRDFAAQFMSLTPATDFRLLPVDPFIDLKGGTHRVTDFNGRMLLVNAWATWCTPCLVELPSLEAFANRYKDRLTVIAVALEEGKNPADIARVLERYKVGDFAAYLDQSGGFTKNLRVRGIPTTFLLGKDGRILYVFEGDTDWTSPAAMAFFDAVLGGD